MALHLGVGAPNSGVLVHRTSGTAQAAGSARSRALRVASQAGWQNPRESSPSRPVRLRAIAAPERLGSPEQQQQRQQAAQLPPAVPPHQVVGAANAILPGPRTLPQDWRREAEEQRKALERLMQQEAEEAGLQQLERTAEAAEPGASVVEEATAGAAAEEEVAAQQAQLHNQLSQTAAAPTSGRGQQHTAAPAAAMQQQQQQQQQQQRARLVPSTRRHRLGSRTKAQATVAGSGRRSVSAPPPSTPSAVAADDLSAAATVRTWLLDCSSRRARGSRQPMAAKAETDAAPARSRPRGGRRLLRGASSAAQPGQLPAAMAAVEGLSEETLADMQVLLNARLQLSNSRRCGKGRSKSLPADAMSSYFRALGNTPVLGREKEARLAGILQKGRELELLATKLAGGGPRTSVDLGALAAAAGLSSAADAAQVLMNRREAKDLLMQHNVRLVINVAKRYANNGIDLGDLIPEGMVGLSKSLDRFEPSKGFKFSTYAHWWIRQSISRAVCDQSRDVRLPSHVCEILYRINRAINTMMEQPGRDEPPSYDEIAAEVGLPVQRVIQYLRLAKVGGGSNGERAASYLSGANLKEVTFADVHEQEGDDLGAEEEEIEAEERAACMRAVTDLMLGTLDKRERNILRMRYGLLNLHIGSADAGEGLVCDAGDGGAATMSLGEVAVAYGLSKERIRQIEDKAMRALRKPWRMQLVRELSFGHRVTPGSLSEWQAAHEQALREGVFLN
ncbi:hypothetical protein ABPG77_008248 [Micractinium sp. CCAP 211/92]